MTVTFHSVIWAKVVGADVVGSGDDVEGMKKMGV